MASKVSGVMYHLKHGTGTEYAIASGAYGYCETAQATVAKTVDMTGFVLAEGVTIHVKFANASVASATLNVNGTGAKNIVRYGTTAATGNRGNGGWAAGAVVEFTYDGTSWVMNSGESYYSDSNTDTKVTQAYSTSNANYPMLLCATSGISSTSSRGATTSILNNNIYANPSTGRIYAKKFYDLTTSHDVVDIQSGSTQPTNQQSGDLWFQTL